MYDVFVRDRLTRRHRARQRRGRRRCRRTAPSTRRAGACRPTAASWPSSAALTNLLVPGAIRNGASDVFVHDRLTGTTERVSVGRRRAASRRHIPVRRVDLGRRAHGRVRQPGRPTCSAPARDTNGIPTTSTSARIDPADPLGVDALLFPDGQLDDTVLEVDRRRERRRSRRSARPATSRSRPATRPTCAPSRAAGTAACPGGSLNGDGDTERRGRAALAGRRRVQNLGCAATAVALSATRVAALVSEAGRGRRDLQRRRRRERHASLQLVTARSAPAHWCDSKSGTAQAADTLAVSGSIARLHHARGGAGQRPSGSTATATPPTASCRSTTPTHRPRSRGSVHGDARTASPASARRPRSSSSATRRPAPAATCSWSPSAPAKRRRGQAPTSTRSATACRPATRDTDDDVLQVYDAGQRHAASTPARR